MQGKAGEAHVFRSLGTVQNSEDVFNLLNVIGGDALGFAIFKQAFQALVLESSNHMGLFLHFPFIFILAFISVVARI